MRMMSQATSSPSSLLVPPTKNRLSGKMPRGVWIYLSSTARLTVVTCTPTLSAICCIFSGSMNSGPFVEELRLVIDDGLRDLGQRVAALLDRFDQPLGRVDLPLDVLPLLRRRRAAGQPLAIVAADVQRRRAAVFDDAPCTVPSSLRSTITSGVTVGHERLGELRPRLGIELAQLVPGFLDRLDRVAGRLLDQRQAVVAQVLQVVR